MYTLETSRSGGGVLAALANLKFFGKEELRVIIGHIVEMAQLLREHLESHECMTVVNRDNFGPVTLFRVYPEGVDTFQIKEAEMHDAAFRDILLQHNAFNRKVSLIDRLLPSHRLWRTNRGLEIIYSFALCR